MKRPIVSSFSKFSTFSGAGILFLLALLFTLGLFSPSLFVPSALAQTSSPDSTISATTTSAGQISEFEIKGLKVLIKRRPGTPTVAAGLFLRGGVRNVTAANAGIENLMLETANSGSKNFPREMLRKELSRTGSVLSSGSNYDYSAFSMISTKQNFARSWDIFTDAALNPSFLAEDVEQAKDRILTSLRAQGDSPENFLESQQEKIIYADHPYVNDPNGTIETVTKLTSADLRAYHLKMMQTSRLLLVVVGDVEPDALKSQIEKSFGKLPRGNYKEDFPPAINFSKPTLDVTSRPLETNYVKGVFAAPRIGETDYYPMRVAMAILQQEVFQEVRVKRNLSYAPGAELNGLAANTGNISVSSVNANEAVKVMLAVIDNIKKNEVNPEAIDEMANFFLTTYYLKQETNAAQAGELASYELAGGGWRNSLSFLDKVRGVKPEDVRRVANKYMTNIRFVVVGNPDKIDKKIFLQGAE
jgi:zinc protease